MGVGIRRQLRFEVNGVLHRLDRVGVGDNLLEYLRSDASLRGTKEGCAEGDCGACTVLVARKCGGALRLRSANACLFRLASADGASIWTIESLSSRLGGLHPIQEALVTHHGSQCGFCTPGIVMSLYALWLSGVPITHASVCESLQGNLCRCTGYAPIVRAALSLASAGRSDGLSDLGCADGAGGSEGSLVCDGSEGWRMEVLAGLDRLQDEVRVELSDGAGGVTVLPASLDDFASLYARSPSFEVAVGSTDLGVQVNRPGGAPRRSFNLHRLSDQEAISVCGSGLRVPALTSFAQAQETFERHYPSLKGFWSRIGGPQIRALGTLGGNIGNGSPVGDTPPVLMALDAFLVLRRGGVRRRIGLSDYYLGYKRQDRRRGEFIEEIAVPFVGEGDYFSVYKVSKRWDEDISTLCGAFYIGFDGDGLVREVRLAYGGMAGVPLRARIAERSLVGTGFDETSLGVGRESLCEDFSPIDDVRGSGAYRSLCAQNLLTQFWTEYWNVDKDGALRTPTRLSEVPCA